jgi:hypothetical protein
VRTCWLIWVCWYVHVPRTGYLLWVLCFGLGASCRLSLLWLPVHQPRVTVPPESRVQRTFWILDFEFGSEIEIYMHGLSPSELIAATVAVV